MIFFVLKKEKIGSLLKPNIQEKKEKHKHNLHFFENLNFFLNIKTS
jgi:hypothetical protein